MTKQKLLVNNKSPEPAKLTKSVLGNFCRIIGLLGEKEVAKNLRRRGHNIKRMPINNPAYDLLDKTTKALIQVKTKVYAKNPPCQTKDQKNELIKQAKKKHYKAQICNYDCLIEKTSIGTIYKPSNTKIN